jgi:N-acetylglutamate synthase-like GNAT family acetyltransferase
VPFIVRVARTEDAPAIARLIAELGYEVSDQVIVEKLNHFAKG